MNLLRRDGGALVPTSEDATAHLTPAEQLTLQFYDWERRGRGWQLWPYPVEIEPPYRPFFHFVTSPGPIVDDARQHTIFSALIERIRGKPPLPPEERAFEIPEPEPEVCAPDSALVEIQIALPPALKITKDAAEQFLLGLSYASYPLSFEIVGHRDAITVQLAVSQDDLLQIQNQLHAHFPEAVLTEETSFLSDHWRPGTTRDSIIVDFGLSREFMLPLRTFRGFDVDPLTGTIGALTSLESDETGVLQVLFQAARYPWVESTIRSVTDWEGEAFFGDAPEMVSLTKEKISRPFFAAVIRVAAQSPRPGRAWQIAKALGSSLTAFSSPSANELIPLENEDYEDAEHENDLLARGFTHRSGDALE